MGNANFIISLDFELKWGVFDTLDDKYNANVLGARDAIPEILSLFDKYDIHATWATVGLLFGKGYDDYMKYKPKKLPSYKNQGLSSYNIAIGKDESTDPMYYGNSIIEKILMCRNQEVASHSYSHYYCNEDEQTIEEFESDIASAVQIANDKFGIELKSFVFPRNNVNQSYLEVLKKNKFTHYRGNPKSFIYKNGHKTKLLNRLLPFADSYFNLTGYQCSEPICNGGLTNITGDRFLRPYNHKNVLNKLHISRIKDEMLFASINKTNYHLWWHPHNFGTFRQENLKNLEEILIYFTSLKKQYGMESKCMKEC